MTLSQIAVSDDQKTIVVRGTSKTNGGSADRALYQNPLICDRKISNERCVIDAVLVDDTAKSIETQSCIFVSEFCNEGVLDGQTCKNRITKSKKKKKTKKNRAARDLKQQDSAQCSSDANIVSKESMRDQEAMSNKHGRSTNKSRSKSLLVVSGSGDVQRSRAVSFCDEKHVRWGAVYAREFTRYPGGGGAIPYDGSWALGLGKPSRDVQLGSVYDRDEVRLEELQVRTKHLSKAMRANVRQGETRQFDYCRGVRNPLFSRLYESERKKLLMQHCDPIMNEKPELDTHNDKDGNVTSQHDFAYICIEQKDEFTKIRDSRDVCGCSCGDFAKKLLKMNQKKLQTFLSSQNITFQPKHSKAALLALAKTVASERFNCSSSEFCECAKNEVPCHESGCDGCVQGCANPNERYRYDRKHVEKYRKKLLENWRQQHLTKANKSLAVVHAS